MSRAVGDGGVARGDGAGLGFIDDGCGPDLLGLCWPRWRLGRWRGDLGSAGHSDEDRGGEEEMHF